MGWRGTEADQSTGKFYSSTTLTNIICTYWCQICDTRENDDDHSEDYKRIISRVNDANYITKVTKLYWDVSDMMHNFKYFVKDAEPMMEYINKSDLSPKSIKVINKESLNQVNYLKTF